MHRYYFPILILFFLFAESISAYEISDILIKQENIRKYDLLKSQEELWEDGCSISKEAKPKTLSIQTNMLYEKPELYEQIMGKVMKGHVNIKCASGLHSILYFKFNDLAAADTSYGFIKGLIWGEDGRSRRHPERIAKYANIITIFASAQQDIADYLQLGKIIYSDVPSEILLRIRAQNSCEKIENGDFCSALEQISGYKPSAFPKFFTHGVFAKIWRIKAGESKSNYMYAKVQAGKIGMINVSPDNDRERAEMDSMIKGETLPTKELLNFVFTVNMQYTELEKYKGSYRTLFHGNLISLYPIGKKVYFIVTADHFSEVAGPTLIGYFTLP